MQKLSTTFLAMIGCAIMPVTASAHHHHHRRGDRDAGADLLRAFLATAAYNSTAQAAADGYGPFPDGVPLHECITAPNPADGAMGFHWLNGANVDTTLDAAHPEVLVYEPQADGSLRLVALEYVVFADAWQAEHGDTPPQLFGRDLELIPAPNAFALPAFYQIHAWIWKYNPSGVFANNNPRVNCDNAQIAEARAATDQFHDTAAATAGGYGPFPEGVPLHECIDDPDMGAMGFHWINGANVDTTLDPEHPAVLVYEPQEDGTLSLVALEYVVFADAWQAEHGDEVPQLFGRDLTFMDAPNRFELPPFYQIHAWIWKDNPAGQYASFNPDVSCQFASE